MKSNFFTKVFLNNDCDVNNLGETSNMKFYLIWFFLTFLIGTGSYLFMRSFDENIHFITFAVIVSVLLWPIIYLQLHRSFLHLYANLVGNNSIDKIYIQYIELVNLKPNYAKVLYLSFFVAISGWVLLQGNFFSSAVCYYGILSFYVPIVFIAAYSTVLLLAIIVSVYKIVKKKNAYKLYQYPSYAAFIYNMKRFNSRISYLLIVFYVLILFAFLYSPLDLDIYIYIILSAVSVFPLIYAIYSIYLQKIIINDTKQEKVVEYEKLVLEGLFDKVLAEPTTENISNYKEKIEFRDYLIKYNTNKSVKLNIELLATIFVAILPIAWQVITYFLSFK